MNTLTTRIIPMILSLAIISCATVEEDAITPTQETVDMSVIEDLSNESWILNDCPSGASLNIDGYTECDYLGYMSFTEESVYIRHGNNTYFTKHNICYVDGSYIRVSRQGCGFTDWNGVIEIEVISYDDETLNVDVSFPNLNSSYQERYIYDNA